MKMTDRRMDVAQGVGSSGPQQHQCRDATSKCDAPFFVATCETGGLAGSRGAASERSEA
jgi:hypothetical protein